MLLIERSKKFRIGYHSGYEFNDVNRHKVYIIYFMFWCFVFMNKDSDITNTFNAAYTTKDLSWVDAVKEEKQKWKDYYEKYWYKDNLEYDKHLRKLIDDRDKEIQMYKDSYHNVLNLARGLRTLQRDGIEVLESLEKK